ncbi:MAG: hypothetical protein CYG60_14100 [Actinobacteria bacterium]|nr:MAG: hypothetical protein CYG60_14100 [Actinomycetota bacterium]
MKAVKDEHIEDALGIAVKNELRAGHWPVYERYELREEDGEVFVVAPTSSLRRSEDSQGDWVRVAIRDPDDDVKRTYAPLRTPELLLEFAELVEPITRKTVKPTELAERPKEEPFARELVLYWAQRYGVLGIRDVDVVAHDDGESTGVTIGAARRESVRRFYEEAFALNRCLRLYEAAMGEGGPNRAMVEEAVAHEPLWAYQLRHQPDAEVEEWVLGKVLQTVQRRLSDESHSQLYRYDTGEVVGGLGFRSLLGAMWMQMSWLLMSDTAVKRCMVHDCRKVVSFESEGAPPSAATTSLHEKRKRRSDIKFCPNGRCKQRYWARKKAGWPGYD